MFDLIYAKLADPHFLVALLIAIAAGAAVITVAMPLLETDTLARRMREVSTERDRIREREREKLAKQSNKPNLRPAEAKAFMRGIVERFSLAKWLGTEKAKEQLAMAGYRGPQAETAFLFFRMVTPITLFIVTIVYVFFIIKWEQPPIVRFGVALLAAYIGVKAPELFLANTITKRQLSMRRAYPNALDLLLICVESGMSIEHAFRKVSTEIGSESVAMAEEFTLTTAELSYLPERRVAFDNLAKRTGLEAMKSIATVLAQSERYGTPVGAALRVLAQESRDQRMIEAEKKAAALPPKLTVPMILFFLPVLFVVILTPALIQIFKWK
jgi:tight adherence protein C